MKLHRNLALAVIAGLDEIFFKGQQADIAVPHLLQSNKNWGARDRNFIAENIYTIVRFKRLYEYCADKELTDSDSLWALLGCKLIIEQNELPAWPEFAVLDKEKVFARHNSSAQIRKIHESIPDWLDEMGLRELGEDWSKEIAALNKSAKLCIRINRIKTTRNAVEKILTEKGIAFSTTPEAADALIIEGRQNLRNLGAYKDGLFEIQDISSQLVAPFLEVQDGMKVIDGCAGAGGKTLQMAALMHNKGEIWAVDVSEHKQRELQLRAKRASAINITSQLKPDFFEKNPDKAWADRILLDVPCSGLGVLRRKPDAKWNLTERYMDDIKSTQAAILDRYSPLLKQGGYLVYSTCSILPSENHTQIMRFLTRGAGQYELVDELKISPADTGFDGFYMAKVRAI